MTFGRKYSRSRKLKILLVFFSLIRTFVAAKLQNILDMSNNRLTNIILAGIAMLLAVLCLVSILGA